jgi:phosphoglycolate phosphatase-like HAD superfamily hydrolase
VAKTILFDIDQTLLYSGGAGGLAMRQAFHKLYGIEDGFRRVEFSGRTDWSILRAAMADHELLNGRPFEEEMARFQQTYYAELEQTLVSIEGRTLPGVHELVDALAAKADVRLGLATGNFRTSAMMKLRYYKLDEHLREGGFGDDSEERAEVVGVAIQRIGNGAAPEDVWVIGDTPLDVSAAHANGARALGVATGPLGVEDLRHAGANEAVEDLSDLDGVLELLLG